MRHAWPLVLLGALVAPLVTWLPMLARKYPRLGLPAYPDMAQGLDFWSMQTFGGTAAAVLAAMLWKTDRWLAAAVGLAGFTIFYRGAFVNQTHAHYFLFGALLLMVVRLAPREWHPMIGTLFAFSGAFQALYILQQGWFNYDVLWGPLVGGELLPKLRPLGTLGTVAAAGGYVAITAAWMPLWLLPLAIAAVWTTHSMAAILALAVALYIKYAHGRMPKLTACGIGGAISACVAYTLIHRGHGDGHIALTDTLTTRATVYWKSLLLALTHDPVLGLGLGGFQNLRIVVGQEFFREAHSEPIQWIAETGIVGLVVLIGWGWTHRQMFRDPRVLALSVQAAVFFPFHVATVALLGIFVVALATPMIPHSQEAA